MFQDPKGDIAQMFEVHLADTVQQNGGFLLFST